MDIPLPEIDLRQLRAFVAVAEELHFGRAAARLGIAQPPLSQQIRRLEAKLGHPLFVRGTRRVALTAAGSALLSVARGIFAQLGDGLEAARRAGRGESGRLRVGFPASMALTIMPAVIRRYRDRHPGVELVLRELTTAPQLDALRAGLLDVGFLREPPEEAMLDHAPVLREGFVAVLPADHPLGRLAGEPFILFPRALGPAFHDRITGLCRAAGFAPRIAQEAAEWQTVAGLVEAGFGVSIAPACIARIRLDGVAYRPLSPAAAHTIVALAWRRGERDPVTARFVEAALAARDYR